jgi:branched-chain amino acid transport system substrate-binding protein
MHVEQMAQYVSFLPRQLYFGSSRGAVYEPQADAKVKAAQQKFFEAFRRAQITVSNGHSVPWDAMGVILEALRQAGPNASAVQIRDYVAALRNFTGIDGSYDFRAVPQRGIGADGTIVYTWEASEKKFVIASKPRGE